MIFRELLFIICKKLKINYKVNKLGEKWVKYNNKYFIEEKIGIVNKYRKWFLILLVISKCKLNL